MHGVCQSEYDDVTQGAYRPIYTTINRLDNEVYNYEEGEWGWWKAPEGDQYVVTSYDEYTAIEDANAFDGTELPYWNALLSGGTWGYYGYTTGKVWQTAGYQPPEDVCYIYHDNRWGWYQIQEIVPGENTTTDGEMVWEKYSSSNNYKKADIVGDTNNNGSWSWKYVYTSSGISSISGLASGVMYNQEKEEWGWWKAPEGSKTTSTSYNGSVSGNLSSDYQVKPYWNEDEQDWGIHCSTVTRTGNWFWGYTYTATHSFEEYRTQPDSDVFYIYNDSKKAWGWYEIEGVKIPVTKVPDKNSYSYEVESEADYMVYHYSVGWPTSYYFNTILRDSIGLDRYGITNPDYNTNYMYPYHMEANSEGASVLVKDEALVANAYKYQHDDVTAGILAGAEITEVDKQALLDAGYSIAYKPTTNDTWEYVEETQGYAIGDMVGRGASGQLAPVQDSYTYGERVSSVSQVNQGQITTYPYNVNTSEFNADSSYGQFFSVAQTHHQYYQLNMNQEDVVVWYCLAGDIYNDYPNDASNFYYIYNAGNVTYTGAGHSNEGAAEISVGREEAKLFVNTMIAAYRAGRVAPSVSLVDNSGSEVSGLYFTVEANTSGDADAEDMLLAQQGVASTESWVPFVITDTNLENPEGRSIALSYIDADGRTVEIDGKDIAIQDSNGTLVANTKLLSNTSYRFALPSDVLNALKASAVNRFSIDVHVTTTFTDASELQGSTTISLYKLALQQLN